MVRRFRRSPACASRRRRRTTRPTQSVNRDVNTRRREGWGLNVVDSFFLFFSFLRAATSGAGTAAHDPRNAPALSRSQEFPQVSSKEMDDAREPRREPWCKTSRWRRSPSSLPAASGRRPTPHSSADGLPGGASRRGRRRPPRTRPTGGREGSGAFRGPTWRERDRDNERVRNAFLQTRKEKNKTNPRSSYPAQIRRSRGSATRAPSAATTSSDGSSAKSDAASLA